MSSNRRIRRDDFDIESIETFHDRGNNKKQSSGSRTRSRSRKRSYSRHLDNDSRSRSRSLEKKSNRRGRSSYSRSRSRSHSRGYSRRNQVSRKYRDNRSRSYSRSRSRSKSKSNSSRKQTERYHRRRDEFEDRNRKFSRSRSRSRSRSSSHFRDFGSKSNKSQNQSPRKPATYSTLGSVREEHTDAKDIWDNLEDLPLPQQKSEEIYHFDENEPIDRERIHREMEEKLRAALAKEGKVYPPPKPEASHPVFANDGSFLEIFKKMQQAQASTSTAAAASSTTIAKSLPSVPPIVATANPNTAPYLAAAATGKSAPPPPIVGRRRGGKILKTGVVAKPKIQTDANADPKDFWSLYLAEVNKYKNTACESEQGNRPLVK